LGPIDSELTAELDEEKISEAFTFSEMVSLAGLARRRFFDYSGYSNRDNYRLVIQTFTHPVGGFGIATRRRDGGTSNLVSAQLYRVPCPEHVRPARVEIDVKLLEALAASRTHANADEFVDSMISFNLANTDASTVSLHVELVLASGAFERLLGCRNGKEDDLAKAFARAIRPRKDLPLDGNRLGTRKRFVKSTTVRDVWVRDLFVLRGDLAHGKVDPEYPAIWNVREHLLLASYLFPFVMKSRLASVGLYAITDSDQFSIDAFEHLARADDLFTRIDEDRDWFSWNEILSNVPDEERMRRAGEILARMMTELAESETETA
jgi:hypothetical protein